MKKCILGVTLFTLASCASQSPQNQDSSLVESSATGYAADVAAWNGAKTEAMINALGAPVEAFEGMPEIGLAPAVSWVSSSNDIAIVELLESEVSGSPCAANAAGQVSANDCGQESADYFYSAGNEYAAATDHECQIYAELSPDGQTILNIQVSSVGDCERWLPVPNRGLAEQLTASAD